MIVIGIAAILVVAYNSPRCRRYVRRLLGRQRHRREYVDRLKERKYSPNTYNGIDVSKHQGVIRWEDVASNKGLEFVYVRATIGSNMTDIYFKRNIEGARKHGLMVGAYHFFTSHSSVTEQFSNYKKVVDKEQVDLIPMVDIEESHGGKWTKQQIIDSLKVFSKLIQKQYGKKPMIYSSEKFYNDNLAPYFNSYILYIAKYGEEPVVEGDYSHNLWKYTEHGHIRGIGEYVDLCRFVHDTRLKDIEL